MDEQIKQKAETYAMEHFEAPNYHSGDFFDPIDVCKGCFIAGYKQALENMRKEAEKWEKEKKEHELWQKATKEQIANPDEWMVLPYGWSPFGIYL